MNILFLTYLKNIYKILIKKISRNWNSYVTELLILLFYCCTMAWSTQAPPVSLLVPHLT